MVIDACYTIAVNEALHYTRNQNECTRQYPELQIPFDAEDLVLDGEMIVLVDGKPCFESVIQRFLAKKDSAIVKLQRSLPAHYIAFDILQLNGERVTTKPLEERLNLLQSVIKPSSVISVCPTHEDGRLLFEAVKNMGLEGIVSKEKRSKWIADTRSHSWLKIKNYQFETVTITGMRKKEFGWSIAKNGKHVGVMEFVPPAERKAFREIAPRIVEKRIGTGYMYNQYFNAV